MTKTSHTRKNSRNLTRVVKLTLIVVISVISIGRPAAWFANAQSLPTDPTPTCIVPPAMFASWFETGSVSLNGVVNPADSITFPNSGNCSFYQWTEQMFLWLLSPAPTRYGGNARILDSPVFYDVSPVDLTTGKRKFIQNTPGGIPVLGARAAQLGANRLPVVMDKQGRMFEVEQPKLARSGKPLILSAGRSIEVESAFIARNGKPVLRDKAGRSIATPKAILRPQLNKSRTVQKLMVSGIPIFVHSTAGVIDTEVGQAGGGDVLEAQLSSNGSLVYYRTSVNDVYAYFLTGQVNGAITPGTQFPTTPAGLNQVITYAAAHGKVFPDPNALCIEVKSSWVEAAGLPNLSSYITMQATIPTFTKTPNQWTPLSQKTVQLALVGIHVVGSAAGHPEMIWGTFEHFGNTPNAAYSYNSTTGLKTVPQNTAGGPWLFCTAGATSNFNQAHMAVPPQTNNIVATAGNTISPSDTLRQKPFGASSASPNPLVPSAAASNSEVIAINNSVIGQLLSGDLRKNYFMMGATWTIGGAAPNFPSPTFGPNFGNPGNTAGNAVGTSQLANTTMETYQQTPVFSATGNNCFNCHVTNTTAVSHVYPQLLPLFP